MCSLISDNSQSKYELTDEDSMSENECPTQNTESTGNGLYSCNSTLSYESTASGSNNCDSGKSLISTENGQMDQDSDPPEVIPSASLQDPGHQVSNSMLYSVTHDVLECSCIDLCSCSSKNKSIKSVTEITNEIPHYNLGTETNEEENYTRKRLESKIDQVYTKDINKTVLHYKNEKNRLKYQFPKKDRSEEELNMYQDNRSIYEIFKNMILKLNDKFSPEDTQILSDMCSFDLRVPQYSPSGVCMLKEEVAELVREWKKQKDLSPSSLKIIEETEQALTKLDETILPPKARAGGFSIPKTESTGEKPRNTANPNKKIKKIKEGKTETQNCNCCVVSNTCSSAEDCVYINCQGECTNITYDNCHTYRCFQTKSNETEKNQEERGNSDRVRKYHDAKENLVSYLEQMKGKTIDNDVATIIKKVNMGKPNKKVRKLLMTKLKKIEKEGGNSSSREESPKSSLKAIHYVNVKRIGLPYVSVRMEYNDKINKDATSFLFDTGSELNICKIRDVKQLIGNMSNIKPVTNMVLTTASGHTPRDTVIGVCDIKLLVHVAGRSYWVKTPIHIIRDDCPLKYGILGMPFIAEIQAQVQFSPDKTTIKCKMKDHKNKIHDVEMLCHNNKYKVNATVQAMLAVKDDMYQITIQDHDIPSGHYHVSNTELDIVTKCKVDQKHYTKFDEYPLLMTNETSPFYVRIPGNNDNSIKSARVDGSQSNGLHEPGNSSHNREMNGIGNVSGYDNMKPKNPHGKMQVELDMEACDEECDICQRIKSRKAFNIMQNYLQETTDGKSANREHHESSYLGEGSGFQDSPDVEDRSIHNIQQHENYTGDSGNSDPTSEKTGDPSEIHEAHQRSWTKQETSLYYQLQNLEAENNEEKKDDGPFNYDITCLCPEHNPYLRWTVGKNEMKKFEEFLCSHPKVCSVKDGTGENLKNPCTDEYSDSPVYAPIENLGEAILIKRDIMNTIQTDGDLDISHLSKQDQGKIMHLLDKYSAAIQSPTNKLGKFRYFQASFQLQNIANASQRNRNIDFQRAPNAVKKINELIDLGVLEISQSQQCCFNFVLVKKFTGHRMMSKADKYIMSNSPTVNVDWRLATDCSDINKHLKNIPMVILPKSEDIRRNLRNKIFSSVDIADQFFCISYDEETRKYCNVYFGHKILQFNRVLQGLASSPFHAQSAMNLTFAKCIFQEWVKAERVDPQYFPYQDYTEFAVWFLDDCLIFTSEDLGTAVHMLAIDAVLYALQRAGWILNLRKAQFLTNKIKWLGVDLDAASGTAECSLDRASAIIEMRHPRSIAEASSRVSLILFNSTFLPLLKKIIFPITRMINTGIFTWNKICAEAYNECKLLLSLGIKNVIFDPNKELVMETDASKLCVAASAFQVNDNGRLDLLSTASGVLSQAELRSPSIIREVNAVTYAINQYEEYILGTKKPAYILTDANAISFLKRSKNSSSRFFEQCILLTSYPNLEPVFIPGRFLTISDILTRAFNDTYVSQTTPLSSKMASIVPPVPVEVYNKIQKFSNEELTDFLLSECPPEFCDLWDARLVYKQAKNHKSEVERMLGSMSSEQTLMYWLRKGWTNPQMFNLDTIKDLIDKQKKLSKTSFDEIVKKHKLAGLKKLADNLQVQDDFIKRLQRNFTIEEENLTKQKLVRKVTMVQTRSRSKGTHSPMIKKSAKQATLECSSHPEGHPMEYDMLAASKALVAMERLVRSWMELGSLTDHKDLYEKCQEFLDQKCTLNKIKSYQTCVPQIMAYLSEMKAFTITNDKEMDIVINFYYFQSTFVKVRMDNNSITLYLTEETKIESFNTYSIDIFLFMSFFGTYTLIQHSDPRIFVDMNVHEISCFYGTKLYIFNLNDENIILHKDQNLISVNLSQDLTEKRRSSMIFIEIDKSLVETSFKKISMYSGETSRQCLERSLENYYTNSVSVLHTMSEKDKPARKEVTEKYLQALNLFILSLKMTKKPTEITRTDVAKMQQSDMTLKLIIHDIKEGVNKTHGYVLRNEILFYLSRSKDKIAKEKLCIPEYLIRMITNSYHSVGGPHFNKNNISYSLSNIYHHPHLHKIISSEVGKCLACQFCPSPNKIKIYGNDRTAGRHLAPGQVLQLDILYLPVCKYNKFPAALLAVDTVTHYVSCLELNKIDSFNTARAVTTIFKTIGLPEACKVDAGNEFSGKFVEACTMVGVNVITTLPTKSNQVSSAEQGVLIVKRNLNKFVSQFLPSKRLMWHQALPIILNNINCSVLRTSKLTRRQLFFSPLTYHHSRWITYDPSLTETPINQHHKKAIDALNKIRNANMMRNANIDKYAIEKNSIVVEIKNDKEVDTQIDGTRSLVTPASDVYKVLDLSSGKMGIRALSLVTGHERTIPLDKVRRMNLSDIVGIRLDPTLLFQDIKESRFRNLFKKSYRGMTLPSNVQDLDHLGAKEETSLDTNREEEEIRGDDEQIMTIEMENVVNRITNNFDHYSELKSILKIPICTYIRFTTEQIDTEIKRLKYKDYLALNRALQLTLFLGKELEIQLLNRTQNILKDYEFDFSSLKRYSLDPIVDSRPNNNDCKKKVRFSPDSNFYNIYKRPKNYNINIFSLECQLLKYECNVSNYELLCVRHDTYDK